LNFIFKIKILSDASLVLQLQLSAEMDKSPKRTNPVTNTLSLVTFMRKFIADVKQNEKAADNIYSDYALQFLKIRLESDEFRDLSQFSSEIGARKENTFKNRYRDILPYDYNRVKLLSGGSSSDYINASYLNGCNGKVAYIATQGPLENTCDDFWAMVVQSRCKTIVMLCELIEDGNIKCFKYWPGLRDKKQYGNARVCLVEENRINRHFTVRKLTIRVDNEKRDLKQFHFHQWPDHSTPEEVEPLIEFLRLVREHQSESCTEPVVVHCSAGCGRTGTFCGLDYAYCLYKSGKLTEEFSIYKLIFDFRRQRSSMVQTREQYVLLHQSVCILFEQFLADLGLDANIKDTAVECATGSGEGKQEAGSSCDIKKKSPVQTVTLCPPPKSKKVISKEDEDLSVEGNSKGRFAADENSSTQQNGGSESVEFDDDDDDSNASTE
ncbi:Tyrosine-protein phosphatase non-receptor type 12, partial [Trichinella nativa]